MRSYDIARNIEAAFQQWEDVCALSFTRTSGEATILMTFTPYKDHGDAPFDGGQLAHAFYPTQNPIGGDVHFNDAVLFKGSGNAGTGEEIMSRVHLEAKMSYQSNSIAAPVMNLHWG